MDAADAEIIRAAVDFVQGALGGYGGNVWRQTHLGRTLIAAVKASGKAVCAECEIMLDKEDVRQKDGSDPFCPDCWPKLHPESDE